jgi:ABC-type sulfate transport system permease subunit
MTTKFRIFRISGTKKTSEQKTNTKKERNHLKKCIFTREYTQCTAGYTFCFVVVVVVVVVWATFSQTWQYFSQQLMKHDWT